MKRYFAFLACCALMQALPAQAQHGEFSFGVIGHSFRAGSDESILRDAIVATDRDNLAFVVANGIKSDAEPCSDNLYKQRKTLLDEAKNGLIVSPAASDWSDCKSARGRSAAVERLNRLRELFFADEFSFGASKIPLARQSSAAKFRNYAENARWEIGDILFATINLPANNNHYRIEAGRNSEFEDRLIANRDWLHRIFTIARHRKMAGIVLFSDGDPLAAPGLLARLNPGGKRDGFAEVRQQINALTGKFPGKVLVIHGRMDASAPAATGIIWRGNLGDMEVGAGWTKLAVDSSLPALFVVGNPSLEPKPSGQ